MSFFVHSTHRFLCFNFVRLVLTFDGVAEKVTFQTSDRNDNDILFHTRISVDLACEHCRNSVHTIDDA